MAVTYSTAVKDARMDALRTYVPSGKLEILQGTTVLATFTLTASAGSVTGGVWTLAFGSTNATASGTGTADAARIRTSGNVDVVTGLTVGTSGTDITIDSTSITSGQTVVVGAITITHG